MLLPYLNKDGYEMNPANHPVFLRDENKAKSFARVARYVECKLPNVQGLIWIGNCEKCPNFKGHIKYHGVECTL